MATFKAIVLKGKRDQKSDGTSNIKIRITHNRQIATIPTDLYIRTNDMDNKSGWAKQGAESESFINMRISQLLSKYRTKFIELGDRSEFMSAGEVRNYIISGKSNNRKIDFFEFIDDFISTTKVKGTADQYSFLKQSLNNFTGDKLPVSEITLSFLFRYEAWMRSNGAKNGIINYMTTFRSLFNKCRDHYNNEDSGQLLIPNYPFRKYQMPQRTKNSKEHHLTIDQIKRLRDYHTKDPREQFARDMFLLMFYLIGIEAKDLFYLGKAHSGRVFYDRFKTGREYSIRLEPEALKIINRYKGEKKLINASERFELHKSFYREINAQLSGDKSHDITGIFKKLGLGIKPTTKWARHSWATIARNDCGINKDDVALCLGHEDADNRVTDVYIKYDYSIVDRCNRQVIDSIT